MDAKNNLSNISKAEKDRRKGKHQVDEQRASILDAAEELFLQKGIENTSIGDIAAQAGVSRITVYRYFANRDEMAVKIQSRMFNKINALIPVEGHAPTLESRRRRTQVIIRNFSRLKDAFRYIGMFDKIYLDQASNDVLPQWAMAQLRAGRTDRNSNEKDKQVPYQDEINVISNNVIWFLEKLALRGELTWSNEGTSLEHSLQVFEDMILGYFDRLIAEERAANKNSGP